MATASSHSGVTAGRLRWFMLCEANKRQAKYATDWTRTCGWWSWPVPYQYRLRVEFLTLYLTFFICQMKTITIYFIRPQGGHQRTSSV